MALVDFQMVNFETLLGLRKLSFLRGLEKTRWAQSLVVKRGFVGYKLFLIGLFLDAHLSQLARETRAHPHLLKKWLLDIALWGWVVANAHFWALRLSTDHWRDRSTLVLRAHVGIALVRLLKVHRFCGDKIWIGKVLFVFQIGKVALVHFLKKLIKF